MVTNRKATGRAMGMPLGTVIGGSVGFLITLILSAVLAWMLQGEYMSVDHIGYGSMAVLLVSSAAGAFAAQRLVKHRKLPVCLVSGAVYYAMLLATTALFFGGQYQGMGVTLAVVAAGAGSIGLLVTKKKKTITKGYRISRTG